VSGLVRVRVTLGPLMTEIRRRRSFMAVVVSAGQRQVHEQGNRLEQRQEKKDAQAKE